MKSAIKLIEGAAELTKAINAWGTKGQKWAQEGHQLALSALQHAAKHGDHTLLNRLYLAMPKGTKSSAMAEWIVAFSHLVPNTDKEAAKTSPFVVDKAKAVNLPGAHEKPWFDFRPEPTPLEVFDLQKAVMAVITKAKKAQTIEGSLSIAAVEALLAGDKPAGNPDPAPL